MKNLILFLLFIFSNLSSNSQAIKDELEGVRFWNTGQGILILGYDRREGTKFVATLYNEQLNVIKQYTQEIKSKVNISKSCIYIVGQYIEVVINTEAGNVILKLTPQLNEILDGEVSSQISNTNRIPLTLDNYKYAEIPDPDKYKRSISGTSLCTNGNQSYSLTTKKQKGKKLGQDYIYCTDEKTLMVSFDVKVASPDSTQNFFVTKGYYDNQNDNLIILGTLYKSGTNVKMNSLGIVVYNKDGVLINSLKIKLPEYESKKVIGWNFDNKSILVRLIGKTASGNYFIHTENGIISTSGSGQNAAGQSYYTLSNFIPIGYSYYELNSKFEIVKTEFEEVKNIRSRNTIYNSSSSDGQIMLLSDTDKGIKKVEYVKFSLPSESRTIELDAFDFKQNIDYNYNPNYDADFFEQMLTTRNNVITFHKFPASNIYELKLLLIP